MSYLGEGIGYEAGKSLMRLICMGLLWTFLCVIAGVCLCTLHSCTYSLNVVHTQGSATDLIDEQQSPTNDINPSVTIPAISGI